ncbi:cell wall hydrolase [Sphingomonas sp.]|uniref:cell wall hydrolase n=1 Tax=Sphingomonas sp. TaxID=28214 RepID=UPI0025F59302|nr:cell wall hydrolase [Sphingomonas sp.]MBV9527062.1 cell wall hydrolase [Sphingomonas sp.]
MLALGCSSQATAQSMSALNVPAVVRALDVDSTAQPFGATRVVTTQTTSSNVTAILTPQSNVTLDNGAVVPAQPARSVTVQLPPSIDREAAWLYKSGWPLYALVNKYSTGAPLNDEATCVATAVYFEARGESLEGQMAVADVVMNRASSGRYPASWCAVVKQPAQFSFVRNGQFPTIDTASAAWATAQGVARLAIAKATPALPSDVLWYHANYVAPNWRHNLREVEQIGAHIFYRA